MKHLRKFPHTTQRELVNAYVRASTKSRSTTEKSHARRVAFDTARDN